MKNILKKVLVVIIILAIAAVTFVPIVTQWGGLFYSKAGYECTEVAIATQRIFDMDKYGIPDSYRDRFIEQLKK